MALTDATAMGDLCSVLSSGPLPDGEADTEVMRPAANEAAMSVLMIDFMMFGMLVACMLCQTVD